MSIRVKQVVAAILAASAAVVGGWAILSLPHLIFHAVHLHGLTTFDKVSQTGSLAVALLFALALLVVPARKAGPSPTVGS